VSPIRAIREYTLSFSLTKWLWENIKDYDLLHIHAIFSFTPTASMIIARIFNIPYVVTCHGLLSEWALEQRSIKKRLYLNLIEKQNLNSSSCVHYASDKEKKESLAIKLTSPSFILPFGLNFPITTTRETRTFRDKLNISENQPILLFMSRLHPVKGLDFLIKALSTLIDKYSFIFIIAGSGNPEYEEKIDYKINQFGLSHVTKRVGFIEGTEKNLLLQESDLFLLTSHLESFGVVVLESMAAGLPVLVTQGVALSQTVQENDIGYVSELNSNAIAQKIQQFLDNSQQGKEMGKRGKAFVQQNYSWDQIALKMISIYKEIINQQFKS
jgi:glycosyltransferase involved in cell wall biosynthesis